MAEINDMKKKALAMLLTKKTERPESELDKDEDREIKKRNLGKTKDQETTAELNFSKNDENKELNQKDHLEEIQTSNVIETHYDANYKNRLDFSLNIPDAPINITHLNTNINACMTGVPENSKSFHSNSSLNNNKLEKDINNTTNNNEHLENDEDKSYSDLIKEKSNIQEQNITEDKNKNLCDVQLNVDFLAAINNNKNNNTVSKDINNINESLEEIKNNSVIANESSKNYFPLIDSQEHQEAISELIKETNANGDHFDSNISYKNATNEFIESIYKNNKSNNHKEESSGIVMNNLESNYNNSLTSSRGNVMLNSDNIIFQDQNNKDTPSINYINTITNTNNVRYLEEDIENTNNNCNDSFQNKENELNKGDVNMHIENVEKSNLIISDKAEETTNNVIETLKNNEKSYKEKEELIASGNDIELNSKNVNLEEKVNIEEKNDKESNTIQENSLLNNSSINEVQNSNKMQESTADSTNVNKPVMQQPPSNVPSKKITFAEAKKEIDEFGLEMDKIEKEIKEKYNINVSEFYYDDLLPEYMKVKLVEEYFNSKEIISISQKINK